MKKTGFISILSLILITYLCTEVFPYQGETHRSITESAAKESVLGAEYYIRGLLGFEYASGLKDKVTYNGKTRKILDWIKEGAVKEDSHLTRCMQHFHDPNEPWNDAGLNDTWSGESSVRWSQNLLQDPLQDRGGNWALYDLKLYLKQALKEKDINSTFQANVAKAFMCLGHIAHLLQDAAVPEHVRNDSHPIDGLCGYEGWVERHIAQLYCSLSSPLLPTIDLTVTSGDPLCPSPITQLWDTNPGTGAISPTAATSIGLAEYTNVNFLSPDTPFTYNILPPSHKHYHPYPRIEDTEVWTENRFFFPRSYYRMVGDGESIDHLICAVYSRHDDTFSMPDGFDSKCHEEYAQKLIPRAVGYSIELINHIFNKEIGVIHNFVYAITETDSFTEVKARLKNENPRGEEMPSGELKAIVKYKLPTDSDLNPSQTPPIEVSEEFFYAESAVIEGASLSLTDYTQYTFDFGADPIPVRATDIELRVIYHGKVGEEEDALVVSHKDLCEPDHINIWNNTDYFCNDGTLIRSNYDNDLDGDAVGDVYCSPTQATVQVTFSETPLPLGVPQTDYDIDLGIIEPGDFKRVVILQDQEDYYFSATYYWIDPDPEDSFPVPWDYSVYIGEEDVPFAFNGVKNQDHIHLESPPEPDNTYDTLGVNFIMEIHDRYVFQPASLFRDQLTQHTIPGIIFAAGTEKCDDVDWTTEPPTVP